MAPAPAHALDWPSAPPESLGMDAGRLDAMREQLAKRGTKNLVVVRRGKIVYEWYAPDAGPGKRHYTASLAKALVGGMSLLLALQDGRLKPDDPAGKFIPAWKDHPQKSRITIRHLATHSSGVEDAEEDHQPHNQLPGWKGAFWKREPDPFSISIEQAPVIFEPGSAYAYSNPGMAALAYAVTASLRGAPQEDIRALLQARVMDPLGIPEQEWSIGYGRGYALDGLTLYANWGGGSFTARAVARVGQLMLQRGEWNGRPLLAPEWVDKVTAFADTPLPPRPAGNPAPASGLGWWTNHDGAWPRVPRDAFAGAGAGNQVLLVVPSLDLVVVRNGAVLGEPAAGEGFWGGVLKYLFDPLMDSVVQFTGGGSGASNLPHPASRAVTGIRFGEFAATRCDAPGSDNWPSTWAGDGHLYTSYGDGWGFEPRTEKKLSQGLARILGSVEDFRGENLRSPSAEREGDGAKGPKASGLLMVDGVLYMFVRNVRHSQLVWSKDHGKTWQWGFRFGESSFEDTFGSPTFLNFGRNYGGARDAYVYLYSQDGPSAYESDDRLVLARVPKGRVRERAAYQFFVRLDEQGQPVWSRDIADRGAVFAYPGHCQRADVVYNAGIGRYLLALGYGHAGGWGIFDAPEPWGPWTTVFHTPYWGLGDTHGYRLPSKWISKDGRDLALVFSGRTHNGRLWDAFCVRRITLQTAE